MHELCIDTHVKKKCPIARRPFGGGMVVWPRSSHFWMTGLLMEHMFHYWRMDWTNRDPIWLQINQFVATWNHTMLKCYTCVVWGGLLCEQLIQFEMNSGLPPNSFDIIVSHIHRDYSTVLLWCGNLWRTSPMPRWRSWLQFAFRCPLLYGFDMDCLNWGGKMGCPLQTWHWCLYEILMRETTVKLPWDYREPPLKSVNPF